MRAHEVGHAFDVDGRRCTRRGNAHRPRPSVGSTRRVDQARTGGHERLAERKIQVHRSGRRTERFRDRATRERTPDDTHLGFVDRRSGIAEPPNRSTEQVRLVDRLARAGVTELRRPVGRAHDQRDARVRRLDHRRVEVRGCRPRSAQHHHRASAPEGEAERPERGRALVEHDLHVQALVARECERERCGA